MFRRILLIALLCLFLLNCASVHSMSIKSDCRHRALISAFTFADKGYPVRIAYGKSGTYAHAQAQVYMDNKWEFLDWDGENVFIAKKDNFRVTHTFTLREFCGRQLLFSLKQWKNNNNSTMFDKEEWIAKTFKLNDK